MASGHTQAMTCGRILAEPLSTSQRSSLLVITDSTSSRRCVLHSLAITWTVLSPTQGMDSCMFHRCYNGTWQDWQRIGTAKHLYSPDAVCWDRNRIDVFSVGPDSQLIHVYANIPNNERGDFHGDWEKLAVSCSGPPKALSRAPNILDVFVKGFKQQVQQKAWNGCELFAINVMLLVEP